MRLAFACREVCLVLEVDTTVFVFGGDRYVLGRAQLGGRFCMCFKEGALLVLGGGCIPRCLLSSPPYTWAAD